MLLSSGGLDACSFGVQKIEVKHYFTVDRNCFSAYSRRMDWKSIIADLQQAGNTLANIAKECGFASPGTVHDLKTGLSTTCSWERGNKLIAMHKRVMRKAAKAA